MFELLHFLAWFQLENYYYMLNRANSNLGIYVHYSVFLSTGPLLFCNYFSILMIPFLVSIQFYWVPKKISNHFQFWCNVSYGKPKIWSGLKYCHHSQSYWQFFPSHGCHYLTNSKDSVMFWNLLKSYCIFCMKHWDLLTERKIWRSL